MTAIKGLAIGIGSLPHQDAQSALDLIFKYLPNSPFWPQLPKRDMREGMVIQFSENIPCLEVIDSGLFFSPVCRDKKLEEFYERVIADDLDYFKVSQAFAPGIYKLHQRLKETDLSKIDFIKLQVTGPFTFQASINDQNGVMLMHDPVFSQVIFKALNMKLRWQIEYFREFGKKIIAFIDEPYLGSFGSAYTSLNKEDIVKKLNEFTENLKREDVLLGVHCCGNTDWSIFTDIDGIDIINFDAFSFQDKFVLYADNLRVFVKRGGIICWGIVPTQGASGEENVELLIRKIREGLTALINKGVDKQLLIDNLMLSPACGLGTFAPEKAEKVFKLLSETSEFICNNF